MQMIYAHRGASGYAPENSLRAFELAAEMGADGVELDIQLTKDGKLVVFHDETLDRVTEGHGLLSEHTYEELLHFPLVRAFAGTNEDHIPLLSDVLALLHRRSLRVNIELKNALNPYPGMEELCIRQVREAHMEEYTLYSSFNHYSLMRMKELDPHAPCGILYDAALLHSWRYAAAMGFDALHPQYGEPLFIVQDEVAQAHRLGLEVNPWTVNDEQTLRLAFAKGCDRIITNYPDRAKAIWSESTTR